MSDQVRNLKTGFLRRRLILSLVRFLQSGSLLSFQILGKITSEGVFLEQLETDPDKYLPEIDTKELGGEVVKVTVITQDHFHTEVSPTLHFMI